MRPLWTMAQEAAGRLPTQLRTYASCAYHRATMMWRNPTAAFAVLAALALISGCAWPSYYPPTLKAIKAESRVLLKAYPANAEEFVPQDRWPLLIGSLGPEFVLINPDGVHIMTKASFDGGWGYFVPRQDRQLPEPVERFEEVGQGVYWWHPY